MKARALGRPIWRTGVLRSKQALWISRRKQEVLRGAGVWRDPGCWELIVSPRKEMSNLSP